LQEKEMSRSPTDAKAPFVAPKQAVIYFTARIVKTPKTRYFNGF